MQDALEKSFSNKAHPLPNNVVFGLRHHAKIMIMIKSRINLRHLTICHSTESISLYIPHQDVIKVQKFFSESSYTIWDKKKNQTHWAIEKLRPGMLRQQRRLLASPTAASAHCTAPYIYPDPKKENGIEDK